MFTVRLTDVPAFVNDKAVTVEGMLYAFDSLGALIADRQDSSLRPVEVYAFHSASHQWYTLEAQSLLPRDRPIMISGRSVVAYGHCAYMWGGWHMNPIFNGLYCFDTRSSMWSRPKVCGEVPNALAYHSACVLGHRMYIFGGYDSGALGHVRFLDLKSLTWHLVRTRGAAPAERACHTASAIGSRMYVWGGSVSRSVADVSYDNSLYYLETKTATWVRPQVENSAPDGRVYHSAFVYGRELYIFGGYSSLLRFTFADIHKYNLERSRWEEVRPNGSGPSARYCHGCSVLGERVWIFGGFWRGIQHANEGNNEGACLQGVHVSDLHVLHLSPTLRNLSLLAAIDAGVDVSSASEFIRNQIKATVFRPS